MENSKLDTEKAVLKFLGLEGQFITELKLELSVKKLPKLTFSRYMQNNEFPWQFETVEVDLVLKENK